VEDIPLGDRYRTGNLNSSGDLYRVLFFKNYLPEKNYCSEGFQVASGIPKREILCLLIDAHQSSLTAGSTDVARLFSPLMTGPDRSIIFNTAPYQRLA
jgi:hypothetical protein